MKMQGLGSLGVLCVSLALLRVARSESLETLLDDADFTEADCLAFLASGETVALRGKHTRLALARGWWDCSAELARQSVRAGVTDVEAEFGLASQLLQRQLSRLRQAIDGAKATQVVNPAFEWAQAPGEVFLNVKFAHKLDAPATLDVKVENVTLTEQQVYLYAEKNSKHFELALDLQGRIVPEESSWQLGSVGRCSFTLVKETRSKWPRLLDQAVKRPQNMHTWWTMQDKYDDELEALEEEEEKARLEAKRAARRAAAAAKDKEQEAAPAPELEEAAAEEDAEAKAQAELAAKEAALRRSMEAELKERLREVDGRRKSLVKELEKELEATKQSLNSEVKKKREAAEAETKGKKAEAEDRFAAEKAGLRDESDKAVQAAVDELRGTKAKTGSGFSLFGREL